MAAKTIVIHDGWEAAVAPAAEVLRAGGVLVFPTETVYGVGVAAGNADALESLRRLKKRPDGKPFQLLVADIAMAKSLGAVFSPRAERLARAFWPGPLTLVLPAAAGETLGIRVPDAPLVLAICRRLGGAIVASSANAAGDAPPADAAAADCFGDEADLLIDAGAIAEGVPSTVARCGGDGCAVLREGGIAREALDAVL